MGIYAEVGIEYKLVRRPTSTGFDDVSVIHHKPLVAQATDYEAWGGVLREQKWIDLDAKYRYGYQGKYAEKDEETGWSHFEPPRWRALAARCRCEKRLGFFVLGLSCCW